MTLRKSALGLSALALVAGSALASAGSATAAPANTTVAIRTDVDVSTGDVTTSQVGIFAALPSCAPYGHSGQRAWVINNCSYTVHAKIIWAFATDSACYTLAPGGRLDSSRSGAARFDGAVSC